MLDEIKTNQTDPHVEKLSQNKSTKELIQALENSDRYTNSHNEIIDSEQGTWVCYEVAINLQN